MGDCLGRAMKEIRIDNSVVMVKRSTTNAGLYFITVLDETDTTECQLILTTNEMLQMIEAFTSEMASP
jgi:hypothetical protein